MMTHATTTHTLAKKTQIRHVHILAYFALFIGKIQFAPNARARCSRMLSVMSAAAATAHSSKIRRVLLNTSNQPTAKKTQNVNAPQHNGVCSVETCKTCVGYCEIFRMCALGFLKWHANIYNLQSSGRTVLRIGLNTNVRQHCKDRELIKTLHNTGTHALLHSVARL